MNDSPFENSILMQYETPLPDNFDMKQVHERIRQVSSPFDHHKGLHFKLYGVNDRIETPLNEYSSIYLWSSISAMREFLVGDLFNNYAQTFARPSIKSWMPQVVRGDDAQLASAHWTARQTFGIPRQTRAGDVLLAWAERSVYPAALLQVIGFDASSWEVIDLTVWRGRPRSSSPSTRICIG